MIKNFCRRHIAANEADKEKMLSYIGVADMQQLLAESVPDAILSQEPLSIGSPLSERDMLAQLGEISKENSIAISLIGQGFYGTEMPAVIQRNLLENPAWYTAYTPYQPEISQGRLEALMAFQTMISDLTALEVANASLLDETSAAAEGMIMAMRISAGRAGNEDRQHFFVDNGCHLQTIEVLKTRAEPMGWQLTIGDPEEDFDASRLAGGIMQYPASDGRVRDPSDFCAKLKQVDAVPILAADLLALTIFTPPGELGAEIAVGSVQRFGLPMGYGGPHAAYIATRSEFVRKMPGRIVGQSVDVLGNVAYRLAIQTREQHIRRKSATSNICTAQVLPALLAVMYAIYHGPDGLRSIAQQIQRLTLTLRFALERAGFSLDKNMLFDTISFNAKGRAKEFVEAAERQSINLRDYGDGRIGLSLDELSTDELLQTLLKIFDIKESYAKIVELVPDLGTHPLERKSPYLEHRLFNSCHSETEMMRYLRRLADRDLALDRTMIPLGSCTMKLNAAAEMQPVSWPAFANIHPYAPCEQIQGYQKMVDDLAKKLAHITGFDEICMQPNSGAQGEIAGLLVIRAWHRANGEQQRDTMLIPNSAHGTNPASAHLAGMKIVEIANNDDGGISIGDLQVKISEHRHRLAGAMITYPSTSGVFEEDIVDICDLIHQAGGQIYLDGANLNAQMGIARPGDYGADVGHINLHKTFCIPHGGGGPGMGPIGVKSHLLPFIPQGYLPGIQQEAAVGPITGSRFGSSSILPISWAFISMMGGEHLRNASETAILTANYVAERLSKGYDLMYRGKHGRVAHECLIDLRPFRDSASIQVTDVAKRLIDYGFHAPTVSFPVAGSLMIEPTESEPLLEIDRFCEAMMAIRSEIASIENGRWPRDNNPLVNAPHILTTALLEEWPYPYSREQAFLPDGQSCSRDKYWPPVARIDEVYGDKHFQCRFD